MKSMRRPRTIVVIPALNEQGKVGRVVGGISERCSDLVNVVVVVIDQGTVDNTAKEAEEAGAIVLHNGNRRGVGAAIRRGIEYGLENRMDICVIMGGDDQDDPKEIPKLLEPILRNGSDFVQGSRYLEHQRTIGMPLSRALLTRLYTIGFRLVTGFPSTDASNGFRAFRLSILRNINIWQEELDGYSLENYLFSQAIKRRYGIKEVKVKKRFDRELGFSHMRPLLLLLPFIDNSFWAVIKGQLE